MTRRKQHVFLLLEYQGKECGVLAVYATRGAARTSQMRQISEAMDIGIRGRTFHIIKKSVQGTISQQFTLNEGIKLEYVEIKRGDQ